MQKDLLTSETAESTTSDQLTLSVEAFHARTFLWQETEQESPKELEAVYGVKCCVWLANYDRESSVWRTSQLCLSGEWAEFWGTWPRTGLMRNGESYRLETLELPTSEKESGLLPTPTKSDAMMANIIGDLDTFYRTSTGTVRKINRSGINGNAGFARTLLLVLPTIGKNEYKGSSRKRYRGSKHFRGAKMSEGLRTCETDEIYLNPSFAEVVMGYPPGWTELEASETP